MLIGRPEAFLPLEAKPVPLSCSFSSSCSFPSLTLAFYSTPETFYLFLITQAVRGWSWYT